MSPWSAFWCASGRAPKAEQHTEKPDVNGGALDDPEKVISWNVNGLVVRLRNDWSQMKTFLESEQPDVLCLQEVRLPAAGPKGCKRGDGQKRRRSEVKGDSAQEKADWDVVQKTLIATFGAQYAFHWSLADWKYSGTLVMIRRSLRCSKIDFTFKSFQGVHCDPADPSCHPEGRVIYVRFKSLDMLATYAPNNGNDSDAFARRKAWDVAMKQEVSARGGRPWVWIGDLNVAADRV
ncbi:DNA-(apurinic or apyrimidinic site) endonuclease (APEX1-like protein) (Apurinic-apyrimidinic endonuclease), partial [Durusdinium trenchii]